MKLKNDLYATYDKGEVLLSSIRKTGEDSYRILSQHPYKLINVTTVERLLLQLEETRRLFDNFWEHHETYLNQYLVLRQFEQEFKELQVNLFEWV